jgi:hypothetical protein
MYQKNFYREWVLSRTVITLLVYVIADIPLTLRICLMVQQQFLIKAVRICLFIISKSDCPFIAPCYHLPEWMNKYLPEQKKLRAYYV